MEETQAVSFTKTSEFRQAPSSFDRQNALDLGLSIKQANKQTDRHTDWKELNQRQCYFTTSSKIGHIPNSFDTQKFHDLIFVCFFGIMSKMV